MSSYSRINTSTSHCNKDIERPQPTTNSLLNTTEYSLAILLSSQAFAVDYFKDCIEIINFTLGSVVMQLNPLIDYMNSNEWVSMLLFVVTTISLIVVTLKVIKSLHHRFYNIEHERIDPYKDRFVLFGIYLLFVAVNYGLFGILIGFAFDREIFKEAYVIVNITTCIVIKLFGLLLNEMIESETCILFLPSIFALKSAQLLTIYFFNTLAYLFSARKDNQKPITYLTSHAYRLVKLMPLLILSLEALHCDQIKVMNSLLNQAFQASINFVCTETFFDIVFVFYAAFFVGFTATTILCYCLTRKFFVRQVLYKIICISGSISIIASVPALYQINYPSSTLLFFSKLASSINTAINFITKNKSQQLLLTLSVWLAMIIMIQITSAAFKVNSILIRELTVQTIESSVNLPVRYTHDMDYYTTSTPLLLTSNTR